MIAQHVASAQETMETNGSEAVLLQSPILKAIDSTSIPAEVSGILGQIVVQEGDRVVAGQLLGQMKTNAAQISVRRLDAQMAIAKKKMEDDVNVRLARNNHTVAKREYESALQANKRAPNTYAPNKLDRFRLLADQSLLEVEKARRELELAALQFDVAKAEYDQAVELLRQHQLRSPSAGLVVSVQNQAGEWVEQGKEIVRILDLDLLRVEGFLPSSVARQNMVGSSAELLIAGWTNPVPAELAFVSPELIPLNSLVRVYLEVPNTNAHLRPGMKIEAKVLLESKMENEVSGKVLGTGPKR